MSQQPVDVLITGAGASGALCREAGAPFPEGYQVPAGDWDLPDAVKYRRPFY